MNDPVQRVPRPTSDELDREARRIAQLRRITQLQDVSLTSPDPRFQLRHGVDPDPKEAA